MARKPNPKAFEAREQYKKGISINDISANLKIDKKTIGRWKRTYNWDENPLKRKQGPPKNSANAKGNKGGHPPKGNKNAEQHGAYSSIYPLTEEEKSLKLKIINNIPDMYGELYSQLKIKEKRLLEKIEKLKARESSVQLKGITKMVTEGHTITTTNTRSTFDLIMRLESELDKTHGRILRTINAIKEYEFELANQRIAEERLKIYKSNKTGEIVLDVDEEDIKQV